MTYRSLWAADVHVGNTLPFAKRVNTDGFASYTDRLMDSLTVLDQMADYGEANGIVDLWFAGDLLDRRLLDAATLKAAMEKILQLADRGFTLRMTPGNHEAQDAAGSTYTLRGFEGVRPNIEVWNESTRAELGGFAFRAVPYKPDDIARAHVEAIKEAEHNHPTILIVHQSLVGGKVGSWVNPDGLTSEDLDGFHTVLAGHFHTPQKLLANPLRMYLGAPIQHNFGDKGEVRGFWDINFSGKVPTCKLIPTVAPVFHSVDWESVREAPPEDFKPDDYIQLTARGTASELARIRDAVVEMSQGCKTRFGARVVNPKMTQEVERKTRAKVASEDGKTLTWPVAVAGYIDACDVTGLSRATLEALAREALADVDG